MCIFYRLACWDPAGWWHDPGCFLVSFLLKFLAGSRLLQGKHVAVLWQVALGVPVWLPLLIQKRAGPLWAAPWPWWEPWAAVGRALGCVVLGLLGAWDGASWAAVAEAVACQPARSVAVQGCVTQRM